jgi:tetratricopeptide (TPR) repeat protein
VENKRILAALKTLPTRRPEDGQANSGAASAGRHLNELIALYNQGRLQNVLERGTALARQLPDNPLIPNILGAAYMALKSFEEAIASFTKALEIDPGIFLAHSNLGTALAALGRHDEAVACYREALMLKPDYGVAHNNLGNALKTLGRLDDAVESYTRALKIKPDFMEAHRSLGVTLRDMGRQEEVSAQFSRALQLDPDDAEMHNSLGVALNNLGRHDAAIASYREALRVKPDLSEAFNNLCELLEKAHRIDDLRSAVSQAQANFDNDDPQVRYWLAELASRDGRHPDARNRLDAIAPHQLPLHLRLKRSALLSKIYDRLDEFDLAFSQFAETNRLAAEWPPARESDATSYFDKVLDLKNSWAQASQIDWAPTGSEESDISLAFMVGFPRSGTTLLETVLRAHPNITVVEEMPLIERVNFELGSPPTFATLNALGTGHWALGTGH